MAIRDAPEPTTSADESRENSRVRWFSCGALALIAFVWLAHAPGLVSSNDGSHLALARALALHQRTSIDTERALTLEVDLAQRGDLAYSDRPPGTAFAALLAVRVGDRLDPPMFERAMAQARAGQPVDPLPGVEPYLLTYAKRAKPGSPQLARLIATSVAIACHAALVGLLGLLLVDALLRRLEFSPGERLFAALSLALASTWGPYATVLFSHVSAATGVAGFSLGVIALARAREQEQDPQWWIAPLTGFAGAWAISCDYLLLVAIVPAALLAIHPRRYLAVLAGSLPVVVATLSYHQAAFGSVLSIGYDHQTNFEFARERGSTFSGELLSGLWTLWGAGRGAGLLAQSPLLLLASFALPASAGLGARLLAGGRVPLAPPKAWPRLLIAFIPWALLLATHRTPWGGGTEDYRYLIPCLPLLAVGLAQLWRGLQTPWARAGLAALALASALLTWRHFLAWHEGEPFSRIGLGLAAGASVLALSLLAQLIRRKLRS